MKKHILTALVAVIALSASAQQVNTLYFLENAPMRHTINPAFQPVSNGFINFGPLGWYSGSIGNNSLTLNDFLFVDPTTEKTITPLHPNADKTLFLNQLRDMTYGNSEATIGLLNMGFRIKQNGYLTIGINERFEFGATMPKSIFEFMLGGGMTELKGGLNTFNFGGFGSSMTMYTEFGAGYSHRINDQWTVGGKLKLLLGHVYGGYNNKRLDFNASTDYWSLGGQIEADLAGPLNMNYLASYLDGKNARMIYDAISDGSFHADSIINLNNIPAMVAPAGYGAALDLGFTYKPIENLQISAAITDLGFIYWPNGTRFNCNINDSIVRFTGLGEIDYSDPAYRNENGEFSSQIVMDSVMSNLMGMLDGIGFENGSKHGMARMTSARLNIGLDANFWDNRIGVGVVSATRLYNARLYEEVTLGVAFRPFNWLSLAASYSLLNNGKFSNFGAGLSLMPYDGINMTLSMDYIPTSFAHVDINDKPYYIIPDKSKMFNVALGFSICWGTNRRDKDKDGVWDKIDMCPDTPRGVEVDSVGCPLDEDLDGVPDYLDHCLGTPAAARGYVDANGCMLDSDGDGIEDYRDLCPNTPAAAYGRIDSVGCPLDSDGDGVADYLDECPNTPEEAYGNIDEKGCPRDSDGDGIPDYLDQCPNTPASAMGHVNAQGCPIDSDEDGVPDFLDECPNTPAKARNHVDARGCILDSDGDGVPDYMDECPMVPGVKANKGCPELKREVRQLLQKAMQGIEFETGKATIKTKSHALLNQIAKTFIENSNYIIEVQGHTDNVGKAEMNQNLSNNRAKAVMNYLISKGVPAERMTAVGYGDTRPIADNKTAAGRQKNRRVEFKITFEEVHVETILDHAQ